MARKTSKGPTAAERKVLAMFDRAIKKIKKCAPCAKGSAAKPARRGAVVAFEVVNDRGETVAYRGGTVDARKTAVAQSKIHREQHFRVMRNGVNTGSALNGHWKSWNPGKRTVDKEYYDLPSNRSDG